ncbi:EMC3/TMCO1 family protein [Candidatus Bathyarchaeota archaeon]|nr:EMC3/TMCO1 family protein [Candidatus Bathyarchaeota archaeon]
MALDISSIPLATLSIMLIAVALSFMNMGLNRLLISRMVGWHEYRSMQKEIAEFNAQRMKAARANDTKLLEKLKKKQSQINSMQMKMSKPQFLLLPMMLIYFVIWPILRGYFPYSVAYVPGFGEIDFFIWYMLCSFFFGTLVSKVIGITPIE